jgi:uncharacterized membrane protein
MSTITRSIDVEVPIRTVYDQWTQFESFPRFMDGVESVTQRDDKRVHWKAEIGGVRREWDAEIVDQSPDQRISWRAVDGTDNSGTILFAPADDTSTRITVRLDFEPEGIVEKAADLLNIVDHKVSSDLVRFKQFIEARGHETGSWRGDIGPSGEVSTPGE